MIDPVDAAVIRSGLVSVAREMFSAFGRAAMLPHLYDAKDFSLSIFDERTRLVADASGLPEFVGSMTFALPRIVDGVGGPGALHEGDVLVASDPFLTGAHPADAAIVAPAVIDGRVVAYCGMRAHMGDLGAMNTYPADATSVYDEGLVFPPLHLADRGTPDTKLFRMIEANSRLPLETAANFRSAAAVVTQGARKVAALVQRFGFTTYSAAVDQLLDAAELEVRALIDTIPDGVYEARDSVDLADADNTTVPLHCRVTVRGSDVHVDLTDAPPQQPGALNVPLPQSTAACRLALKRLTTQDGYTANSGEYRMLEVAATPGTIFHAQRPAASFMMATTASLLSEMVVTALAPAMPDRAMAPSGGHTTGIMGWMPEGPRGKPVVMDALAPIGYGATAAADGMDARLHFCLAGMGNSSSEVVETRTGAVLRSVALVTDSGGAGRRRGGLGTRMTWELPGATTVTVQAQRIRDDLPGGLQGGHAAGGRNDVLVEASGRTFSLGMAGGIDLEAGSVVSVFGAGGAGFGDPRERPPEEVLRDVLDGVVSGTAAAEVYGVAIDPDTGLVDTVGTARLRAASP